MASVMEKLQTIRFDMHTRILITAVFLVAALIATISGAFIFKVSVLEAQELVDEIEEEFERLNDPRFIFGNNLLHALIMFVPIVGPVWGCFVLFNTGTFIAVFSISNGIPPILTFLSLFFTPIFWLEFGVYSIAMAQSAILLMQMLRGQGKREAVRTCILVTICALILLLSAIVEWIMINISNG